MFSQHSRRHSNDTNSDLSDDEIFLPDETKTSNIRRTSKTGEILASPTHRKLTPTHIKSTNSSPIKRVKMLSRSDFRSFDADRIDNDDDDDIHEHYRKVIAELKQTHEDNVKHLQYKLQSLEAPPADDEYLVSKQRKLFVYICTSKSYCVQKVGNILFSNLSLSFVYTFQYCAT